MPRKKVPRPKVAQALQAAAEAFVSAVKLQAAGDLKAAHDAMQTVVLAAKESLERLKLQHPWSEREQLQLDIILRGAARSNCDLSLGEIFCGPSPDEARDRIQQFPPSDTQRPRNPLCARYSPALGRG